MSAGGRATVLATAAAATILGVALHRNWGLWLDEAASAGFAALPWAALFGPEARQETNPPTYYALLKLWSLVFGGSDASLRAPSALALGGAVLLLGHFAARHIGWAAGVFAALLLAGSGWAFLYGQQARAYAPVLAVFVLGMVVAQDLAVALARQRHGVGWRATALALIAALLASLHYALPILAAALFVQAGAALLALRAVTSRAILVLAGAALCSLLLATPVLLLGLELAGASRNQASWIPRQGIAETLRVILSVLLTPPLDERMRPANLLGLSMVSAAATLLPLGLALRHVAWQPALWGCIGLLGFGVVAFTLGNQAHPIVLPRTVMFLLAPLLVLCAAGLAALPRVPRLAVLGAWLAPQAVAIVLIATQPIEREDWRALAGLVAERAAPGEAVLVFGHFETVALQRGQQVARTGTLVLSILPGTMPGFAAWVVRRMAGMDAVTEEAAHAALCAERTRQVWFIFRGPPLPQATARTIIGAGAERPLERQSIGILRIERWPAPECAPA